MCSNNLCEFFIDITFTLVKLLFDKLLRGERCCCCTNLSKYRILILPFRILFGIIVDGITLILVYTNIGLTFWTPEEYWKAMFNIIISIDILFPIVLLILSAVYIHKNEQDELIHSKKWKFSFFLYRVLFAIAEIFIFCETYTQSESYNRIKSFTWYEIVLMVWEIVQLIMEVLEFNYLISLVSRNKLNKEMEKIL